MQDSTAFPENKGKRLLKILIPYHFADIFRFSNGNTMFCLSILHGGNGILLKKYQKSVYYPNDEKTGEEKTE